MTSAAWLLMTIVVPDCNDQVVLTVLKTKSGRSKTVRGWERSVIIMIQAFWFWTHNKFWQREQSEHIKEHKSHFSYHGDEERSEIVDQSHVFLNYLTSTPYTLPIQTQQQAQRDCWWQSSFLTLTIKAFWPFRRRMQGAKKTLDDECEGRG